MKIIKNFDELKLLRKKKSKEKIVLAHGVFDLFHYGHLNYLIAAKKKGDLLVVSITSDKFICKGPDRPIFNDIKRAKLISALEIVDYVFISKKFSSVDIILNLKPNFYCKGLDYLKPKNDYLGNFSSEKNSLKRVKGKIVVIKTKLESSSKYMNEIIKTQSSENFLKLKNYSLNDIKNKINKIGKFNINLISSNNQFQNFLKIKNNNILKKSLSIMGYFCSINTFDFNTNIKISKNSNDINFFYFNDNEINNKKLKKFTQRNSIVINNSKKNLFFGKEANKIKKFDKINFFISNLNYTLINQLKPETQLLYIIIFIILNDHIISEEVVKTIEKIIKKKYYFNDRKINNRQLLNNFIYNLK